MPNSSITVDQNAWEQFPGPIALIAGPGTGKTHQLALRINNLVNKKNVDPNSISVITFTKEAAKNMWNRISDEEKQEVYLPLDKRPKNINTMHSCGLEIIKTFHDTVGLPEFFDLVTNDSLRKILYLDSAIANKLNEDAAKKANNCRQTGYIDNDDYDSKVIIQSYENLLRKNASIDYDDQILLACKILENNTDAKHKWNESCKHLLVDEYQDINPPQYKFINLLSEKYPEGLFVVGDDDQSIYSFRGGSPNHIRNFISNYGDNAKYLVGNPGTVYLFPT